MKRLLILICFIPFVCFSQNKNIKVVYEYYSCKPLQYDTELIANSNFSKFINKHKSEHYDMDWYKLDVSEKNILSFYNFKTKEYIDNHLCKKGEKKYASWKFNDIWNISNETKDILGYKVIKATRKPIYEDKIESDIVVWFAPDLPYFTGPEYYLGLPGLVLEAGCPEDKLWGYYTAKKVEFINEKLTKPIKIGKKTKRLDIRNCN